MGTDRSQTYRAGGAFAAVKKNSPTLKPSWWHPAPAEGRGAAAFASSAAPGFMGRVPSPPRRHRPVSVRAEVPLPRNTGVRIASKRRKAAKNKNMQKKKKNRRSPKHQNEGEVRKGERVQNKEKGEKQKLNVQTKTIQSKRL